MAAKRTAKIIVEIAQPLDGLTQIPSLLIVPFEHEVQSLGPLQAMQSVPQDLHAVPSK